MQLQIEKHADRVGQHLTNHPVLIMPQVMDANPRDGKPFRQMRAHRLNQFAPAPSGHHQRRRVARGGHAGTRRGEHRDPVPVLQLLVTEGINEALVCRDQPAVAFDQRFQMVDVMGGERPARDSA